jgi:integrating conjugative element protein (TIGR03759 family)
MIWNVPGGKPGQERRKTWPRIDFATAERRGAPGVGFFRIVVPGLSLSHFHLDRLGHGSKCLRRRNGQTKIRTHLPRLGRVALGIVGLIALAMLALSTLTCPLAAESTPVQERSALATPTAAAPHGETPTLIQGFNRQEWGLSEAEWQRYHTLLQGIRGSLSPATLSPLEVLGIHARDDRERADYAQRWAQLMQEDTARILAFQLAYDQASAALNPSAPLIDLARLRSKSAGAVQTGDRLLLFVRLEDCARCEPRVAEALALQRTSGAKLDIFVVGDVTDEAIRAWATRLRIDPAAVRDRRLTLNHDRGELVRVAGVAATVPVLVRVRNGAAVRLETPFPS